MFIFTKYLKNLIIAAMSLLEAIFKLKPLPMLYRLDLLANAVFFGDPQETISSRAGKMVLAGDRGFAYFLCRLLHIFDKDHCSKNILQHEGGDELIVLDRGVVIGSLIFSLWVYYPDLFMSVAGLVL